MAPLQAWEKANPDYQINTRRRENRNSYRKWDDSKQAFIEILINPNKENVNVFSLASANIQNSPKNLKKLTGLGRGKSLPMSNHRSLDNRSLVKVKGRLPTASLKPKGERARFTPTKSAGCSKIDECVSSDKLVVLSDLDCQQSIEEGGEQADASVVVNEDRKYLEIDHKNVDVTALKSIGSRKKDTAVPYALDKDSSLESGIDSDVKALIEKLQKRNSQLMNENRTYSIIAEVALKGSILWSPNDSDSFPLSPVFNDQINKVFSLHSPESDAFARVHDLFDQYGHLSPTITAFATNRATHVRDVINVVLIRKRNELIFSLEGYDLPNFLILAANFIPQIQFLSENGIGDNPEEQKCGIDAAWDVLMDMLKLAIAPLPNALEVASWTMTSFTALSSLDRVLLKTLRWKMQTVPGHAMYWAGNVKWVRSAEVALEHVAGEMARAGNGIGDQSWFLRETRNRIAEVLDRADKLEG